MAGNISKNGRILFNAVSEVASKPENRVPGIPKLAYIYSSGTWIHGENRSLHRSDGAPLPNPPMAIAWRPALEQDIIKSDVLRGIVLRPSLCYGRGGSLFAFLFSQGGNGQISWFGQPGGGYALIHIDDLAEAYLLAVEKVRTQVPRLLSSFQLVMQPN